MRVGASPPAYFCIFMFNDRWSFSPSSTCNYVSVATSGGGRENRRGLRRTCARGRCERAGAARRATRGGGAGDGLHAREGARVLGDRRGARGHGLGRHAGPVCRLSRERAKTTEQPQRVQLMPDQTASLRLDDGESARGGSGGTLAGAVVKGAVRKGRVLSCVLLCVTVLTCLCLCL